MVAAYCCKNMHVVNNVKENKIIKENSKIEVETAR